MTKSGQREGRVYVTTLVVEDNAHQRNLQEGLKMRAVLAASAIIMLSGCGRDHQDAGSRSETASVAASRIDGIITTGPELDAAFLAVFGEEPPARWKPSEEWDELVFTPVQLIRIGETHYLLSAGQGMECHVCSGALTVSRLSRSADEFAVLGERVVVGGNGWGMPPEIETRTDLFAHPALVVGTGFAGMGCVVGGKALYELTPTGIHERVARIPDFHSFEDMGVGETSGEFVPGQPGESFEVRYTGARNVTVTYRRSGEAFVPSTDLSEAMMC